MKKWLLLAGFLGAGAGLGWLFGNWLKGHSSGSSLSQGQALVLLPLTLVGTFLAILAHEAGHAVAACANGWRFHFLAAGPLWLEHSAPGLRLRWNRLPAGFGGLTLCVPTGAQQLERGAPWYYAGGPLASLAMGLICGLGSMALSGRGDRVFSSTLGIWSALSLAIFAVTTLLIGSELPTDGARLWRWLRRHPSAPAEAAMLRLSALIMAGERPRDYPPEDLEALSRDLSARGRTTLALLLAAAEADRGQRRAALERLEALAEPWEQVLAALRPALAIELALWSALEGRPSETCRAWLERGKGGFAEAWRRKTAEAAIELAAGQASRAVAAIAAAHAFSSKAMFPLNAADRELLAELSEKCRACHGPSEGTPL